MSFNDFTVQVLSLPSWIFFAGALVTVIIAILLWVYAEKQYEYEPGMATLIITPAVMLTMCASAMIFIGIMNLL